MNFTPLGVVIIIGALQGLTLSVAICRISEANKLANRVLALFVFLISITLLARLVFFDDGSLVQQYPHLVLFPKLAQLSYGPLVYLYIVLTLNPSYKMPRYWGLHFIPVLLHSLIIGYYLLEPAEQFSQRIETRNFIEYPYIGYIALTQFGVYLAASFYLLRKKNIHASTNELASSIAIYLKIFLTAVTVCWCLWLYGFMALISTQININKYINYYTVWVAMSFLAYLLAYFAMVRQDLFKLNKKPTRYQGSNLSAQQIDKIKDKLETLMKENKPYLDSDLTLSDLAKTMSLSPKDLSRVINECFDKNFFKFINDYRAQEFMLLVREQPSTKLPLINLAYQAGFNSKTTFNTTFKELTGQTPTQYIRQYH